MKSLIRVVFFTAVLVAIPAAMAQEKDYKPSEIQLLRLQVKQKDAFLAQRDVNDAQTRFNQALTELQDEAKKVETENSWADVTFNPQDLSFKATPKAAVKDAHK